MGIASKTVLYLDVQARWTVTLGVALEYEKIFELFEE